MASKVLFFLAIGALADIAFSASLNYINCACPEGYHIDYRDPRCELNARQLPCNMEQIPSCDCPDGSYAKYDPEYMQACIFPEGKRTKCLNANKVYTYVDRVFKNINTKPDDCKCDENMGVMIIGDKATCVNSRQPWWILDCGMRPPPFCKCREGQVYISTSDRESYACTFPVPGAKEEKCTNQDEIDKYQEFYVAYFKDFKRFLV